MYLIDQDGKRAICRECRKVHAAKDCPRLEWRIIEAIAEEGPYNDKWGAIARRIGVSRWRVHQTVARLRKWDRSRLG